MVLNGHLVDLKKSTTLPILNMKKNRKKCAFFNWIYSHLNLYNGKPGILRGSQISKKIFFLCQNLPKMSKNDLFLVIWPGIENWIFAKKLKIHGRGQISKQILSP